MSENNELWFTVLGPSGAGKTTLLACMHKNFEEILPGSFYPADSKTFSSLNLAYNKLEAEANNPNIEFSVGIEGTSDLRQYAFAIKGKHSNIPVRFFDFPGGWMDPHDEAQSENHRQVIQIVQQSMVIMVAINTPYIMEYDGRYKNYAGIENIQHVIKTSLINSDNNKLIIFVPIKCERYTRTATDNKRMKDKIKEVFDETLRLSKNPVYKDRLAIALLPVHTVGNAHFSRFSMKNGEITQEVYVKNRSMKFSPKDADQPLRFAMSFLLNEFVKGNSFLNFMESLFSKNDLNIIGSFVRDGMKIDNDDFVDILCGKELITDSNFVMPEGLYQTMKGVISHHVNISLFPDKEAPENSDKLPKIRNEGKYDTIKKVLKIAFISAISIGILSIITYCGYILEQMRLSH